MPHYCHAIKPTDPGAGRLFDIAQEYRLLESPF
jgi:hypothetical protein